MKGDHHHGVELQAGPGIDDPLHSHVARPEWDLKATSFQISRERCSSCLEVARGVGGIELTDAGGLPGETVHEDPPEEGISGADLQA